MCRSSEKEKFLFRKNSRGKRKILSEKLEEDLNTGRCKKTFSKITMWNEIVEHIQNSC